MVSLLTDDWLNNTQVTFFLFQLCCIVYLGLIWDLSRNFTFKRWLPRMHRAAVDPGGGHFTHLQLPVLGSGRRRSPSIALLHGFTVGIQAVVIGLGLRDLVHGPRNAADKLWAAAGLYIMLGIAFGELIHFVHSAAPGYARAATFPPMSSAFTRRSIVSFATLTGGDNALSGVSHFCRNLLAMESLMAQLYVVMLISRLLASDQGEDSVEASAELVVEPSQAEDLHP
jgi:hypothetical protein